jgi:periplasmic nitrate reductase NapD
MPGCRRTFGLVAPLDRDLHICSLAVRALPSRVDPVQDLISRLPGVEIHATTADGGMVVTIEAEDAAEIPARVAEIRGLAGVVSAALAFHQTESGPDGSRVGVP